MKKYKYNLLRIFFKIIKFEIIAVFLKSILVAYKKFHLKNKVENCYKFSKNLLDLIYQK